MSAANGIAVIGDPCNNDTAIPFAGAIFVYDVAVEFDENIDPLTLRQIIENPVAVPGALFGLAAFGSKQTISTDGNLIVVGSPNFGERPAQQPAEVFALDGNTFEHVDSIETLPGNPGFELFGLSVRLLGDRELAISQGFPGLGFNGAVHLYDLPRYVKR